MRTSTVACSALLSAWIISQCCAAVSVRDAQSEASYLQEELGKSYLGNDSSTTSRGGYPDVLKPHTWICLTTSGERAIRGGSIENKKICGSSCPTNSTSSDNKEWIGYVGALIAIVMFGSNFLPIKKYDTGDGIFFQWVLCIGIWLVGFVVNLILQQPPFFLPTIIGGAMWTTGNLMAVPIIKMIGMTMGLTVWGVTNMLTGWVIGRFVLSQDVSCSGLNIGGVCVVVLSVIILAFVKSEGSSPNRQGDRTTPNESTSLLSEKTSSLKASLRDKMRSQSSESGKSDQLTFSSPQPSAQSINSSIENQVSMDESWVDKLGVWPKRVLGFVLSLIAGLFYAILFLPVQYLKLCDDDGHSCSDLDYIFGVYSGILFTSTFYFAVYGLLRRNRPLVYPKVILPGLVAGIMWGIAMVGWFLSNQYLSLAISFPIVTAGPGFVSSAWGILLYREIKGWYNLVLFFIAFAVSSCGLVLNGLSRCTVSCGHHK